MNKQIKKNFFLKNLLFNVEEVGSIPGEETKIPHAAGQLSSCSATREAPMQHNKDPTQPKKTKQNR